jgi:hypothetical protein
VDQLVDLRFGRGDYARVIVAGIDYGYSGKAVEVLAAVFIPDMDAARVIDDYRRN